jgi:hypothetical protein
MMNVTPRSGVRYRRLISRPTINAARYAATAALSRACYDHDVTANTKKGSGRRDGKVTLKKATASEILAAVKVSPAEERRAKSAVASIRRSASRVSGSVKRLSVSKRRAAS